MLKLILWLLGVPSAVPFLEALCYTGYPLVLVCINTAVVFLFGTQVLTTLTPGALHSWLHSVKDALTPTLFVCRWMVLLCSLGLWLFVYGHLHSEDNEESALQRGKAV